MLPSLTPQSSFRPRVLLSWGRIASHTHLVPDVGGNNRQLTKTVKICHFPRRNKAKFRTKRIFSFLLDFHLERGDLKGSCEDNCETLCLGKNSSIVPSKATVSECTKRCLPKGRSVAVIATDQTADLQVVNCNSTSVEIRGSRAADVAPGFNFVYVAGDIGKCTLRCSPLFRKVISIAEGAVNGSKILTTTFSTFGEVLGQSVKSSRSNEKIEPALQCKHSLGSRQLALNRAADKEQPMATTKHRTGRELQVFPNMCSSWLTKKADGRCTHTNCFVGQSGDPSNCFSCKKQCDNGCGAADADLLKFSGNFGLFSFAEACCIHDHCYSSTFDKSTCDREFFVDMATQCLPSAAVALLLLPVTAAPLVVPAACNLLATAFYAIVLIGGGDAYAIAKETQKKYEETDICTAKCPTTQESGGQGTTRLVIDLLRTSGVFPVTYNMYSIPDQLYITYEGTRIFDTGGLISGSQSLEVSFSGKSQIIEVTIFAPNSGTRWDVFIGCPGSTKAPVRPPTKFPTRRPTKPPTKRPTKAPTKRPTKAPTKSPTRAPTKTPTLVPIKAPIAPAPFPMSPFVTPPFAPMATPPSTACLGNGQNCTLANATLSTCCSPLNCTASGFCG
jgi:hypothetical protein